VAYRRPIVRSILSLLGAAWASGAAAQGRPVLPPPTVVHAGTAAIPSAALQLPSDDATPDAVPTEATLGIPVYPTAAHLTNYDAGNGQTYHIFGTDSTFEEMVRYYTVVLDERGDTVFTAPPVHVFEIGRFLEESMSFSPSVTIKDYTWNGSEGYLNPKPGGKKRYRTIIQIVPPPANQPTR